MVDKPESAAGTKSGGDADVNPPPDQKDGDKKSAVASVVTIEAFRNSRILTRLVADAPQVTAFALFQTAIGWALVCLVIGAIAEAVQPHGIIGYTGVTAFILLVIAGIICMGLAALHGSRVELDGTRSEIITFTVLHIGRLETKIEIARQVDLPPEEYEKRWKKLSRMT